MSDVCIGDKITLKSDKGVFTIISTMKQKDGLMYEVTNGIQTFWTNRANFSDKPKIEQMCLFDFADEIASQKPEEPEVRVYKAGDRFSNGGAVVELIPLSSEELSIRIETCGYRMEYGRPFRCYDVMKDEYQPITDDTEIAFAALGFKFWREERGEWIDLNGDSQHHIPWLGEDAEINRFVEDEFGNAWHGDEKITVRYDFRDVFMMKWLGLEKLPSRHLQRINGCIGCKYSKEQRHLMTYYDIEMPFGEFLKFLHMKEDKRK